MKVKEALKKVKNGFQQINIHKEFKESALKNIEKWLSTDQFKDYKEQLLWLIEQEKFELLLDCFYQVIPFGTGGRRGPVGIGPNRINPWTIQASAQGHSDYLIKHYKEQAKKRGVVLVFDVRKYPDTKLYNNIVTNPVKDLTSKQLAEYAAQVYAANGIRVYMFDDIRSTPELSFAIRHLKAVAGDNFSASHNPKEDNGKKVFCEHGGQLIPPYDQELADEVNNVKEIKKISLEKAEELELLTKIGREVDEAYLKETTKFGFIKERGIKIVYSPLCGCGSTSTGETLRRKGFDIVLDDKTAEPDGAFTNIKYNIPNPEVFESFETLTKKADDVHADLCISTDPDADRIGICVKKDGKWVYLNGNEIGIVLTHYILAQLKKKNNLAKGGLIVQTLVTTSLIPKIAKDFGVDVTSDLLVGFKYIAEEIQKLEDKNELQRFIFGAEESNGYLVGTYTRDKDASVAAVLLCELASMLKKADKTVADYLYSIYRQYGYMKNDITQIIFLGAEGKVKIDKIQHILREKKLKNIGKYKVSNTIDRWDGPEHVSLTDTVSRNVLVFYLGNTDEFKSAKITVRPSGTEPKTKIYVEVEGKLENDFKKQKEEIGRIAQYLLDETVKICLKIADIEMPERGLRTSHLMPIEVRLKYFDVEEQLIQLKKEFDEGKVKKEVYLKKIDESLKIFGADPVEKIAPAFELKAGKSLRDFMRMIDKS